jgi:ketosteroid isomerase-like protein
MNIPALRFSFLLLLNAVLTATAFAQTNSKEAQPLHDVIEKTFEALNRADTAALNDLLTNDVHFYEYGESWDIERIRKIALKSTETPDFHRVDNFDYVRTKQSGNTAWVTYYLKSDITRNGKTEAYYWMETVILVKEKGKWRLDVLHSTRLEKK